MFSHRLQRAACLAACFLVTGCCGSLRCGGPSCGDGCAKKSPYAFMKYDGGCETCGGGFCGRDEETWGSPGAGCAGCGGKCASCAGNCSSGGCGCGKQSPCWLLNGFATCAGCGERYWNEWYNDPPRCAEPCDCYGNWIGPGHGGYYRAPYATDGYIVGQTPAVAPLELAETEPAEGVEEAVAEAIEQSDAEVQAALATGYDDAELADGLR